MDLPLTVSERDPGDEDDAERLPEWQRWRFVWDGRCIHIMNRRLFEEPLPVAVNHDPGDADIEWAPLSDVSAERVMRSLVIRRKRRHAQ